MPQSIPKGLTRENVLKALADLDAGIKHLFGTPTGYELIHGGGDIPRLGSRVSRDGHFCGAVAGVVVSYVLTRQASVPG
jgi:hypothetical protein